MTQKNVTLMTKLTLILALGLTAFSCAPKKQGVRATVKSGATSLNPTTSAVADQQAQAQNAIYKISTITVPQVVDGGVEITSELLTPNGQYLPITTTHSGARLDSQGVYNDSARGLQVLINARCSDVECVKYTLLVTVTRSNQAVYQSGAISFKDDCNFSSVANNSTTGSMFQSMDAFANSSIANVSPKNDWASCQQ